MIEALKPFALDLLKACVTTLSTDNEENALVASRIAFDLHKTFRPNLEEPVPEFLEFARKVGWVDAHSTRSSNQSWCCCGACGRINASWPLEMRQWQRECGHRHMQRLCPRSHATA